MTGEKDHLEGLKVVGFAALTIAVIAALVIGS